jgi:hypothetical protein
MLFVLYHIKYPDQLSRDRCWLVCLSVFFARDEYFFNFKVPPVYTPPYLEGGGCVYKGLYMFCTSTRTTTLFKINDLRGIKNLVAHVLYKCLYNRGQTPIKSMTYVEFHLFCKYFVQGRVHHLELIMLILFLLFI